LSIWQKRKKIFFGGAIAVLLFFGKAFAERFSGVEGDRA
jgi:hypothetical protein